MSPVSALSSTTYGNHIHPNARNAADLSVLALGWASLMLVYFMSATLQTKRLLGMFVPGFNITGSNRQTETGQPN